jgi:hypothetical protein
MTATLPSELRDVFERSAYAELVTIDDRGRPIARSVSPSYHQGGMCIDIVMTQAAAVPEPRVALLFATTDPMVLVQGTAQVQDVLHVRPERVYAWSTADPEGEPRLYDAHLEEVRSGHNEEPEIGHAEPEGGRGVWDARLESLVSALLACVGPDGFPFAAQLTIEPDPRSGLLRFPHLPIGMPVEPGPACLHERDGQRGTRVHGDLVGGPNGWGLIPHAVVDD